MANLTTQFGGFLTTIGVARQTNANALGIPWKISHMLIGDAGGDPAQFPDPTPSPSQAALVRRVYRAPLNSLYKSPQDPGVLVAELILPPDIGGWWMRELALEDADGNFVAVAKPAPSYKPLLTQGSGRTQTVRMHVVFGNVANVALKIDPAVVTASREWVDLRIAEELAKLDAKTSCRYATKAAINLSGLAVQAGADWVAPLAAGDRILVKNQTQAALNGIYVASAGAWLRSTDADSSAKVTAGLTVSVETGVTQADTIWQLVTDDPIVLGGTALTFMDITNGLARLLSPAFAGVPTAPAPTQFDASLRLATTGYVTQVGQRYSTSASISGATALSASAIGGITFCGGTQSSYVVTLPEFGASTRGGLVTLAGNSEALVTVAAPAGASLTLTSGGVLLNPVLERDETAVFMQTSGIEWRLVGGTLALKYSTQFSASLGATGWKREPSGFIEQWGVVTIEDNIQMTITLPIAFNTAVFGVMATTQNAGLLGGDQFMTVGAKKNGASLSTILIDANTGPSRSLAQTLFWRAYGK
ncbi:phage tail protein [Pseudomonas sp. SDI]|uniref:phage tail protein n=1 Tax=Pseudomonas sp. SDI TaxID=2170734 RepID=UPI000DE72956|nr:phage tail protein [Pseudomonas sp. SDI]PWB34616.1 phage tail protein [Pseudomonas sp. SDI]